MAWNPFFSWPLLLIPLASAAASEAELRVRLSAFPATLDWNRAFTAAERPILQNIMEGLFETDSALQPVPRLAESWAVSKDGKTYTFKLRKNVRWSDGKKLSSDDFLFSWQRLLDPKTAAPFAYVLAPVVGASEYTRGTLKNPSQIGISAPDPSTLVVRLKEPTPHFLSTLTLWATYPLRRDLVEKNGAAWANPDKIQVLGPFRPVESQPDSHVLLRRNEIYSLGKAPEFSAVRLQLVTSDATAAGLFQAGKLDYAPLSSPREIGELRDSAAFRSRSALRSCFLTVNPTRLSEPKQRQALAAAVDRTELERALEKRIESANSLFPERLLPGKPGPVPALKPTAPGKLQMPADLQLLVQADEVKSLVGEILQQQFKRALGLEVRLHNDELKLYLEKLKKGEWDLALRCWNPDFPDPASYLNVFTGASANRFMSWQDAEYDRLVLAGRNAGNYLRARKILQQDTAIVIPLYFERILYLVREGVSGLAPNASGTLRFREARYSPVR